SPAATLSVVATQQNKFVMAGTGNGLVYSEDGGRTWNTAHGEIAGMPIGEVIGASARNRFYARGYEGLFRTDDGGVTWFQLNAAQFQPGQTRQILTPDGWSDTLLVLTDSRVFRS